MYNSMEIYIENNQDKDISQITYFYHWYEKYAVTFILKFTQKIIKMKIFVKLYRQFSWWLHMFYIIALHNHVIFFEIWTLIYC